MAKTEWQRWELAIPKNLDAKEREALGREIVEYIRERASAGKGVVRRGNGFQDVDLPGYSKSYRESKRFEIAGKGKTPNFQLSGDTLGALDVLTTKKGKIVIGWERGSTENAIADGNIRGTYGQPKTVGPKRNILGLPAEDLRKLLKDYQSAEKREEKAAVDQGSRTQSSRVETEEDDG